MADDTETDVQNLRHLHALRTFVGNLVDQAEKSGGCECHKPPSLLLVGPPGVGKTYLVKQMSKVCELPLFGVHTNTVKNGASINRLFKQAREHYPSLVFLDDVESVFVDHDSGRCGSPSAQGLREEIFRELGPRKLKILDPDAKNNPTQQQIQNSPGHSSSSPSSSRSSSLSRPRPSAPELSDSYDESLYPDNNGIIVVAATSQPWLLYKDHELLSRFRGVYLVGLPDKQTRFTLLQTMLQELHHTLSDEDVWEVANQTQGFTPADLLVVIKTLSYRQLSFLLQPGVEEQDSSGEGSEEGSEGSTQATLSSLSETGSDTDIDGLSEPKNSKHRSTDATTGGASTAAAAAVIAAAAASVAAAAGRRSGKPTAPAPPITTTTAAALPTNAPNDSEGLLSRIAIASVATAATVTAAAAVAELARDWGSESEDEAGLDDGAERPAAVKQSSASPDSGMAESRSSEETIARLDQPDCPSIQQHRELQQQQHSPALTIAELLVTQTETNCMSTTQNATADKYDSDALESYRGDEVADDTRLKANDVSRTLEHQNLYKEEQEDDCSVKESDIPHESTDSDGFMLGNDTFSSSDCTERFSSDYFPHSSSTHTPPLPTIDDTEDHSAYDNVTPNDNSHHSDDDDTYDKSDNDTVFERDLVSGEEVDATGCTETEEVIVHPEYKSGPSLVNGASDGQTRSRSSTSSCSLSDNTAPATSVNCTGTDSPVIGSDGGVSGSNMTAVSADFTGTNGVDSITIHGDECSLELHYSEPPEGENMAVDDSDSDNDTPPVMRSRRVGFAPRPAAMFDSECNGAENSNTSNMNGGNGGSVRARSPLSVNCGTGDLPPNIALDDGFTDSNGILRQLLSGPSLVSTNGASRTGCQPSPGASPTPPASPALSHCSSGAATLASSGSGRATPQRQATRGPVAAPMWAQEQHGDEDQHQQVAHAPLQDGLAKRNGVDDRHHDSHHHHDTHNHLNHDSHSHPQQEQQQQKAREEQDQDQSAAVKGVSGLGAAAAAVAAVVSNGTARQQHGVTEDDMAKFLGALEATLDGHAANDVRGGGTSDGESCDDSDDSAGAMPCIKPITLVDVLEVIAKDYRSVPDEEVKKYTEFMVWFANVAKSACPHNNGTRSEATTLDDDDVCGESTLCATPSLLRRNQRRRPLKKLGKFLLKALMFILD